ncbi:MAG: hypothetical protein ACF8PN_08685 [Phycisphaerales bacterium]
MELERSMTGASAWGRRLGVGAFLFFLIKGLLWLAIPAIAICWKGLAGGG